MLPNFFYFSIRPFFVDENLSRARVSLFSPLCFTTKIRYQFFEIPKSSLDHQKCSNHDIKKVGQQRDDALQESQRNLTYLFGAWILRTCKIVLKRCNFWLNLLSKLPSILHPTREGHKENTGRSEQVIWWNLLWI